MGSKNSREELDELDHRAGVLANKVPATARSIAHAFVIKDADVFFVAAQHGAVPEKGPHGFGLYHHDCRFLSGYVLQLDGRMPILLGSTSAPGYKGVFELTNPVLPRQDGGRLDKHELAVRWDRVVEGKRRALHDVIRFKSYATHPADVEVSLWFRAGFEDVFAVRGLTRARPGRHQPPAWAEDALCFSYEGADGKRRITRVRFWRHPDRAEDTCARFLLHLEPEAEETVSLSVLLSEEPLDTERHGAAAPPGADDAPPDLTQVAAQQDRAEKATTAGLAEVRTSRDQLHRTIDRSRRDLAMLRSMLGDMTYYAAGVPWFVALFGRDAITVALESLAFDPDIAVGTLRLLAAHQADRDDPSRDEEPGKILHEFRVGELAHTGAIPHKPYYGTVDATPLFLVLLARHAAWTGRMDLFHELRPNVDAALGWIADYGESKTSGFVEYRSRASGGLANQGWKDSGDAIVMKDGSLAKQPIALVEVQGYVYLAKTSIAALFDRAGEHARAEALRREAEALKDRFDRSFWLADEGFFALALTREGPAAVLSSNPGQALWTGIVRPDHARATVQSLLSPQMWSGWGIRTLSEDARRYNPIAYHRGTVWPHDNSIIAAGFRRYGFDDAACRVFNGLFEASTHFPLHRLPELMSGFRREDYGTPIRYPVACHPQAWAAGSIPFLLTSLLGLASEGFDRRLRVVRPVLPEGIGEVEIHGLRVGDGSVDLAFGRQRDGSCEVRVLGERGGVEVRVDREGSA